MERFNPYGRCNRFVTLLRFNSYLIVDWVMVQYAEDRSCITKFELGELFHKGQHSSRDYKKAFKWYQVAAINGSRHVQHRLGTSYARGQEVARSFVKDYDWCKVAAFQNSSRGKQKLNCLETKMGLDQIREVKRLAQEYYDQFVTGPKKSRPIWTK